MKIYIDTNDHCHASDPDGTMTVVETEFFDGKCDAFIEGYCYEIREDGTSIYPWKQYAELDAAQREYERQKLAEYEALIDELYAEVTGL